MSIDAIDRLSITLFIGIMLITAVFSIIIGIITVVVSRKMKKEGKKDHKTWFYISIYCFSTGALEFIFAAIYAVVPALTASVLA